jgi:O-antigen ligase
MLGILKKTINNLITKGCSYMKMSQKYNHHIYMTTTSLITLILWYFNLESIGIPIFVVLISLGFITIRNTIGIVPLIMNSLFMVSQLDWSVEMIPAYLYFVPIILMVAFIAHIVRFKVNLFSGELLYSSLLLLSTLFLSIFNMSIIDINYIFLISVGILYIFLYFFFNNTISGDNTEYLIKLFTILGILVSLQVLIYYLRVEDIEEALRLKSLDLGWGISNFIATYLIIFISTTVYYVKKYKTHIIWILIVLFEITMLFLTLSRGGIVAFLITSIVLIVYSFFRSNEKVKMLTSILIGLIVLSGFIYWNAETFTALWDRLVLNGMDDSGRFEIWQTAFDQFLAHPLFGVGLYSRLINDTYLGLNHNTILQTAASFGIVGLIALGLMFYETIKVFFKNINHEKMILFIALIGANIHGMVDNVFYMPQFMIIFFIIIAVVENANKAEEEAKEIA